MAASTSSSASVSHDDSRSACRVAAWMNLELAREKPTFRAARDRLMKGLDSAAIASASSAGLEIEQRARESFYCELTDGRHAKSRVLKFEGDFPQELQNRVLTSVPGATVEDSDVGKIVRIGAGWLSVRGGSLLWADQRPALEHAIRAGLAEDGLSKGGLLSVRFSNDRFRFAPHSPEAEQRSLWNSAIVSVGADGTHSELRFLTDSNDQATKLLDIVQGLLKELANAPKAPPGLAHADLATEADGSAVTLHAALPPDELVRLFTAVSSRAHFPDRRPP